LAMSILVYAFLAGSLSPPSTNGLNGLHDNYHLLLQTSAGLQSAPASRDASQAVMAYAYLKLQQSAIGRRRLVRVAEQTRIDLETAFQQNPQVSGRDVRQSLAKVPLDTIVPLGLVAMTAFGSNLIQPAGVVLWVIAILLAWMMRTGPILRASGVLVQGPDGRPASRFRSAARNGVAWLPFLLFCLAPVDDNQPVSLVPLMQVTAFMISLSTLFRPDAGIPDVIADTIITLR